MYQRNAVSLPVCTRSRSKMRTKGMAQKLMCSQGNYLQQVPYEVGDRRPARVRQHVVAV